MNETDFIPTEQLEIGMFVAELDIPWLESPFLLQGFVIEDEEQLADVRRCSKKVRIDRSRSIGTAYQAPVGATPVKPRSDELRVVLVPVPAAGRSKESRKQAVASTEVPTVLEILRSIMRGSSPPPPVSEPAQHPARGSDSGATLTSARAAPSPTSPPRPSAADVGLKHPSPADEAPLWRRALSRLLPRSREDMGGSGDTSMRFDDNAAEESNPAKTLYIYVPLEEELPRAVESFERAQTALACVLEDLKEHRIPEAERVQDAAEQIVASVNRNPDAMLWLISLKKTDRPAYDHALNVSVHMSILGLHLALPQHEVQMLAIAGLLLDVGRMRLPDSILTKTGELTPEERTLVQRHVGWSVEIVNDIANLPRDVVDVVARHHERWNGSGYPAGLSGEIIGLHGEIAGICDSYCAMLTARPHAAPRAPQSVLQELGTQRGITFSEGLVDQLVQCVGAFPVGALIELNTGEIGIVIEQNRIRRLKPRVLLLLAADKSRYDHPVMLSLINDPIAYDDVPYRITKTLPNGSYGLDPREFYL